MIELSISCVWLACLSAYLCSENQRLISTPLHKVLGWAGYAALMTIAYLFAVNLYSSSVALLVILASMMMSWLCIVLINGHRFLKALAGLVPVFLIFLFVV